jgi:hypothetical protein
MLLKALLLRSKALLLRSHDRIQSVLASCPNLFALLHFEKASDACEQIKSLGKITVSS